MDVHSQDVKGDWIVLANGEFHSKVKLENNQMFGWNFYNNTMGFHLKLESDDNFHKLEKWIWNIEGLYLFQEKPIFLMM